MVKKVVCIDKGTRTYLTLGKVYEVVRKDGITTMIIDDSGIANWYSSNRFKDYVEEKKEYVIGQIVGN